MRLTWACPRSLPASGPTGVAHGGRAATTGRWASDCGPRRGPPERRARGPPRVPPRASPAVHSANHRAEKQPGGAIRCFVLRVYVGRIGNSLVRNYTTTVTVREFASRDFRVPLRSSSELRRAFTSDDARNLLFGYSSPARRRSDACLERARWLVRVFSGPPNLAGTLVAMCVVEKEHRIHRAPAGGPSGRSPCRLPIPSRSWFTSAGASGRAFQRGKCEWPLVRGRPVQTGPAWRGRSQARGSSSRQHHHFRRGGVRNASALLVPRSHAPVGR